MGGHSGCPLTSPISGNPFHMCTPIILFVFNLYLLIPPLRLLQLLVIGLHVLVLLDIKLIDDLLRNHALHALDPSIGVVGESLLLAALPAVSEHTGEF